MSAFSKTDFADLGVDFTSYAAGVITCTTVDELDLELKSGDTLIVNDNRALAFWVRGVSTTRASDGSVTGNSITIENLEGGIPADSVLSAVAADAELSSARVPTSARANADHVYGIESDEERDNPKIAHAGWVAKKTFPQTGRRAHRVQYETLVAMGGMQPGTKHFDHLIVNRIGADTIILSDNDKALNMESFYDHVHAGTVFSFAPAAPTNYTVTRDGTTNLLTLARTVAGETESFTITASDNALTEARVALKELSVETYDALERNSTDAPTNFGSPLVTNSGNSYAVTVDLDTYFTDAATSISGVRLRNRPAFLSSFDYDADTRVVTFTAHSTTSISTSIQVRVAGYDASGASTYINFRTYVQASAS